MAEENKHPPTTEEQAPPEMSGKAPEMEQVEIPGLAVWGVVNLLEGYGSDNAAAKSQGIKQFMAN